MQSISSYNQKVPQKSSWQKFSFAFLFVLVFFLTFVVLYLAGNVPDEIKQTAQNPSVAVAEAKGEEPVRIVAQSVGIDSMVLNPTSTDTSVLNGELLKGAVRYPGSGLAGKGNMFIFGHSTNFQIVNNQAFKTFDNLKDFKAGDSIEIYSKNNIYYYRVAKVSLLSADKVLVNLETKRNMLTLSSCDMFGTKEQRYVVEADYVGSKKIPAAATSSVPALVLR